MESRASIVVLAFAIGTGVAGRATAAPQPTLAITEGRLVSLDVRHEPVHAYTVRPMRSGLYPGVVVIHEWWGLNGQIKAVADRVAESGYIAIAPDLYRGKLGTDAGLAHELMRGLNENYALDVIRAAVGWIRTVDTQTTRRAPGRPVPVATLGFCMGGRLSLAAALGGSGIQAAVMFYGSVETDPKALEPLSIPLLGIFGNEDRGIPLEQIQAFDAALKKLGKDATVLVYPGAGHAFFNEERPGYDREAAGDAWSRTRTFLAQKLAQAQVSPAPKVPPKKVPGDESPLPD
jgi:carboxymethylenebutenolidase